MWLTTSLAGEAKLAEHNDFKVSREDDPHQSIKLVYLLFFTGLAPHINFTHSCNVFHDRLS